MMNVLELQDKLKNFSEDQLVNEMQQPSGSVPQYLVLSEINRRKRIRDDYQQQQQGQQSNMTVAQEKLAAAGMPQEGLAGLAESMAPQTDMTMNTGATPDQTMPMPEAPAPMAEAQPDMAGGIASMAKGGYVRRLQVGGPPSAGVVVRNGMQFTVNPDGSITDPNGQIVTDPAMVADILGQEPPQDERSWGQRNIGDPLRSLFQPIGEAAKETFQPVGEAAKETFQPIGEAARKTFQPIGESINGIFDATAEPAPDPFEVRRQLASVYELGSTVPTGEGTLFDYDTSPLSPKIALENSQNVLPPEIDLPGLWSVIRGQTKAAKNADTLLREGKISPDQYERLTKGSRGEQFDVIHEMIRGESGEALSAPPSVAVDTTPADTAAPYNFRPEAQQATTGQGLSFGLPSADTGIIDVGGTRPELSFGSVKPDDAAKTTTPSRGAGSSGGGGGGGAGSVESQIIEMLKEREKRAENDKWLALAQAGMALMSSTQPTLGGALGEAGAEGLKAFRASRDEYEGAKLELLKAQQAMAKARASGASAKSYETPTAIGSAINMFTELQKGLLGKKTIPVTDPYGETSYETVFQTYDDLSPEARKVYDSYSARIADLTNRYSQFFPADMTQ